MLVQNKTKIVCTIGPASESPEVMADLLHAGMNIARLNFSHGEFSWHETIVKRLRTVARDVGNGLTIMADLPGPKIRVGQLAEEPVLLKSGAKISLTTDEIVGDAERIHVSLPSLTRSVKPGDQMFLNDGIILLETLEIRGNDVVCRVVVGGELRSRKGLNLPGIDLGISAFTEHDHACMEMALGCGVDAVSQSFVACAADIEAVRSAAEKLGYHPFIIAKIERVQALDNASEIMAAADGVMIARGDLGVEIPLDTIGVAQKQLISQANVLGKPVITATQMLDSMVHRSRPTRAEVTDVTNAILDGTDCVMLSEESAMGNYPVEAVAMLSKIAVAAEAYRPDVCAWEASTDYRAERDAHLVDFISRNVNHAVDHLRPLAVVAPTTSGHTARMISRFKLPVWIVAVSDNEAVCQGLQFSYGVCPRYEGALSRDWEAFSRQWMREQRLPEDGLAILIQGPSKEHPEANPSLEIITPVMKHEVSSRVSY